MQCIHRKWQTAEANQLRLDKMVQKSIWSKLWIEIDRSAMDNETSIGGFDSPNRERLTKSVSWLFITRFPSCIRSYDEKLDERDTFQCWVSPLKESVEWTKVGEVTKLSKAFPYCFSLKFTQNERSNFEVQELLGSFSRLTIGAQSYTSILSFTAQGEGWWTKNPLEKQPM